MKKNYFDDMRRHEKRPAAAATLIADQNK